MLLVPNLLPTISMIPPPQGAASPSTDGLEVIAPSITGTGFMPDTNDALEIAKLKAGTYAIL